MWDQQCKMSFACLTKELSKCSLARVMSYYWTRFHIPGGFYPQSNAQRWSTTVSCKYKENWGWQLVWQMTDLMNNDSAVLLFMACLQSVCRTKKNSNNSDLTWRSFNHSRPPLCMWLILQKSAFVFARLNFPKSAARFSKHTTGTNDAVSQVWTLTPLALLPSMQRIVGKNRKKKLLVGQAKCEYWI